MRLNAGCTGKDLKWLILNFAELRPDIREISLMKGTTPFPDEALLADGDGLTCTYFGDLRRCISDHPMYEDLAAYGETWTCASCQREFGRVDENGVAILRHTCNFQGMYHMCESCTAPMTQTLSG